MNEQNEVLNHVFSNNASIMPKGHSYLKRDHIQNLLYESIQKPVMIAVAGAGYGKTQTIYSFLQEYGAKTIWQQLTVLDNLPARFWNNFVNVISLSNPKLASALKLLGFPDTGASFDTFLSCLSSAMLPDQKYVMVYDDFHLIHDKKVLRCIERLINTYVPNLSVVLISRKEPEISTAGILAKELLSIISEDDLRFSKDDMIRYYEMQNIHISPNIISKLYQNTDGWIMAIRLAELSLKKGIAHEEFALTAMKLNIFRLIESDIYSVITEDVQIFLVKLSLFAYLPLELVRLLSSGNEQLIVEISKIHSFIRYDSFSNIYCIHHMFLSFLEQKQDMLTQSEKIESYQKAADWYALNGYRIDAINYYGKTGDYRKILNIALIFPYASLEEAVLLFDILSRIPKEAYDREPLLSILRIRALVYVRNMREAMDELKILIKKYENMPQSHKNISALCEMYILVGLFSCFYCTVTNDFDFAGYFILAYNCISEKSADIKVKFNIQEVGTYVCRISSEKKEDMVKYLEALNTVTYYAPKVMPGCMCGMYELAQAELAYFKNSMKASEKFALQALWKAREAKQYVIDTRAIFYLIRIALAQGDYIKIQDLLKQLDLQLNTTEFPNNQMLYDIMTGWFYSVIRHGDKVSNWIKSNFIYGDLGIVASGVENLTRVKYCLSEKKYHDFLLLWESQKNEYSMKGINAFLFGKIAMIASKAVCLYHTDEKDEAIKALQEAYYLAEPNSMTMQFIELGNDMVTLAKFALKSEDCAIPADWLQSIIRKSSTYAKRLSHIASEYKRANSQESGFPLKLTKNELELLNDISHGMSIAEMAMERGLSQNYLNNRMQTIYSKLGAANKIDAVRIATAMNLIR